MTLQELVQAARFTILLGKNGSGKSTHLRAVDSSGTFKSKYISPERGGVLKYDANVDQNITNNENWLASDRRKNRTEQFRPQSAVQFRNLEILVLREIEKDQAKRGDATYTFDTILERVNLLLPAISMHRADKGFSIANKAGEPIREDQMSSGESELIALAIEVLVFARESGDNRVLLLDEPDVHLHPDLQQRFIAFVEETARKFDFRVVVATHSTAIIGAFTKGVDIKIAPVTRRDQTDFHSFFYSEICHSILPIFGAHPLSAQFNRSSPLLVEGEDDRRVIDQIVRSSNGRYMFSPCVVGTVEALNEWEQWLNTFLPSIYDDPRGFSLRDLDNAGAVEIDDLQYVRRARLNCYAIENILLTDESLRSCNHTEASAHAAFTSWIAQKPTHQATPELTALVNAYGARRTFRIKDIRNLIVGLLGISKPWEVHVGQLIASPFDRDSQTPNSLRTYLGPGVLTKLFPA
jgi:ABC-type cobalamin/Fe3+-siderophores transport system ATPase subunit